MNSERTWIIAGFILITIIWGSTWLAIKIGLESIPPLYGVALRFNIAVIILWLIIRGRNQGFSFDKDSIALYIIMGLLSFSFPFILIYWAEQYIPSGLASILFATYPFIVAILSHFILPCEKLNMYKAVGIGIGFCGIILIFWSDIQFSEFSVLGMIAIIVSTILQGIALVVIKKKGKYIHPVSLNLGGMFIGLVIVYLFAIIFEDFSSIKFNSKGIGSLLYLGTFGTVVPFVIYFWLLKRIEAVYMSLVALVTPIIAVILGAIWYNETLSPQIFKGGGCVLLGILITNVKEILQSLRKYFFINNCKR